jgi:hypothetical protein
MKLWPSLLLLLVACAAAPAAEYVPPPKLPPCPRVIGSVYDPAAVKSAPPVASASASAPARAGNESASVVAAAASAPAPPVSHVRAPYKAPPRAPQATSAVASCGDKKNPCPLQRWMREKMAPALAANDAAALAVALDKMAKFSPTPGPEWKTMSETAAEAARKGDVAGARKSCQGCHNAFKAQYKEKLRTRPVL